MIIYYDSDRQYRTSKTRFCTI